VILVTEEARTFFLGLMTSYLFSIRLL